VFTKKAYGSSKINLNQTKLHRGAFRYYDTCELIRAL
jgi:hypothetical protein